MKRSLFIAPQRMPIKCSQCREEFIPNGHTGENCLPCVMRALAGAALTISDLDKKITDLEKRLDQTGNPIRSTATNSFHKISKFSGTGDELVTWR